MNTGRSISPRAPADPARAAAVERYLQRAEPHVRRIGAEIRAEVGADGRPHSVAEIHAAMHAQLPEVAAGVADVLLLSLSHRDHADQDDGEALTAALDAFEGLLRLYFEEFGPTDDAALAATVERCRANLLAEYRALAILASSEGRA